MAKYCDFGGFSRLGGFGCFGGFGGLPRGFFWSNNRENGFTTVHFPDYLAKKTRPILLCANIAIWRLRGFGGFGGLGGLEVSAASGVGGGSEASDVLRDLEAMEALAIFAK